MNDPFAPVGMRPTPPPQGEKKKRRRIPLAAVSVLSVIILGCLLSDLFIPNDPSYMDLVSSDLPPSARFMFGTDSMGRDIFSMIWHGGRISLFIGIFAAFISAAVAILIGTASALSPKWLDSIIMRLTEIFLSIPTLLLIVFIQAILGKPGVMSLSLAIGMTGWTGIAKVVRTEVKRLRHSEYIIASRCMGAGFFHILLRHLIPNIISPVMFMVIMNIKSAIIAESTLSFIGLGLPLDTVSWGSMLSLAERDMLSGSWQSIIFPGIFLITTLLCITKIAGFIREGSDHRQSNL